MMPTGLEEKVKWKREIRLGNPTLSHNASTESFLGLKMLSVDY